MIENDGNESWDAPRLGDLKRGGGGEADGGSGLGQGAAKTRPHGLDAKSFGLEKSRPSVRRAAGVIAGIKRHVMETFLALTAARRRAHEVPQQRQ